MADDYITSAHFVIIFSYCKFCLNTCLNTCTTMYERILVELFLWPRC